MAWRINKTPKFEFVICNLYRKVIRSFVSATEKDILNWCISPVFLISEGQRPNKVSYMIQQISRKFIIILWFSRSKWNWPVGIGIGIAISTYILYNNWTEWSTIQGVISKLDERKAWGQFEIKRFLRTSSEQNHI